MFNQINVNVSMCLRPADEFSGLCDALNNLESATVARGLSRACLVFADKWFHLC